MSTESVWLFVCGMTTPDWAAIPLDAGTRQVISDGMIVLFERGNVLSRAGCQPALLLTFEEFDFPLMLLCSVTSIECTEVSALPRFGIFLF